MSKIIFIDDEPEILEQYKNVKRKKDINNDNLKKMASDFFDADEILPQFEDELSDIEILTAGQGLEGIKLVQDNLKMSNPVQIAFIDMRMPPGIDGKETAKRLRAMDKNIEIVIVTAYSDARPDEMLTEIGSPDKLLYLKKPFDIAEIKQIIRNLTTKYRSERLKDEFVSNVTHELKTPLASILGFSELLLNDLDKKTELYEYARILHINSVLMNTLVSDLIQTLEVSRDTRIVNTELVDLVAVLMDTYQSLNANLNSNCVPIELNIPNESIFVNIDSIRFRQVLYNVIGNALKFTEKGQVSIKIEHDQKMVKLSVADTGAGISQENLSKIFDKFFRVENEHHNQPGLGLGLFIVKHILDAHSFPFTVVSEEGVGTTFEINIPKGIAA